jgi:hypothetical protein
MRGWTCLPLKAPGLPFWTLLLILLNSIVTLLVLGTGHAWSRGALRRRIPRW